MITSCQFAKSKRFQFVESFEPEFDRIFPIHVSLFEKVSFLNTAQILFNNTHRQHFEEAIRDQEGI